MAVAEEDAGQAEGRDAPNPHAAAAAFAEDFRRAEYALKRSGYLRKRDVAEADWDAVARELGPAFHDRVVALGIAPTLVRRPPRRLMSDLTWGPDEPAPLANAAQLIVNGVCRVRNSYIHGEKFTGGPEGQWDRDLALVTEAHVVLTLAIETLLGGRAA